MKDFQVAIKMVNKLFQKFEDKLEIAKAFQHDNVLEMVVGNERGGFSMFETNLNTDGDPVSTHYIYSNTDVKIFPNPSNDYFNIELETANPSMTNISVFNSIGQQVVKDSFNSSTYKEVNF